MEDMGIAYTTPSSYQARQYQQSTGVQNYNEAQGQYNINLRNRITSEQAVGYSSGNIMMNGACKQPPYQERDINSSYPPEIRTAHSEMRTPHPMVPPAPIAFAMHRDKRKGGRFFRRLIRPFRNLIKRPQPSEKFVETSQGWFIIIDYFETPRDLYVRPVFHPV